MAAASAPNYRSAPGGDRCDGCFFRAENGLSCTRFPALEGYRPNHVCDDYSMRSCAQRFTQEGEVEKPGDLAELKQTITGVEIFAKGEWNGRKYGDADLNSLVEAAKHVGYKPPVSLGHNAPEDAPAYGYVVNVRRDGDKIVADFEDVPDELVEQIKEKRFDQVSSEIFLERKVNGKKWPCSLRAVAVIGAHPPGVSNLKSLSDALGQFSAEPPFERVPYRPQETTKMTVKTPATEGDEAAATIAKLQADLAAATARAETATAAAEAAKAAAAPAADMQLTIQKLSEQVQTLTQQTAEVAERERQGRIDALVKGLNRPPYRAHVQALAELATRGDKPGAQPEQVNFQAAGADKAAPTSAFGVLEDLVRLINQDVAHLFTEQVRQGTLEPGTAKLGLDDPSSELFALMGAYMRANPGVTRDQAIAVVEADPKNADLIRRYNNAARPN